MLLGMCFILFYMYALEQRLSTPFLYTFPLVISSSVVAAFVFAFADALYVFKALWGIGACAAFGYAMLHGGGRRVSAQHLVFAGIMALVYLVFREGRLMGWDPFFWADFSKYIHMNNGYWSSGSIVFHSEQHRAYPPGFALLSALYLGFSPYHESSQFISFATPFIMLGATILKLCDDYLERGWHARLLLVAICLATLKTLGIANPVNFLSADIGIACLFVSCLLVAMYERDLVLACALLAVMTPFLSLTKSTSVLLSLTVLLMFFVHLISSKAYPFRRVVVTVSCLLAVAVLPLFVWDYSLGMRGIVSTGAYLDLRQVLSFFDDMAPAKALMLENLKRYFVFGPLIIVYPKALQPLVGTAALLAYSCILSVTSFLIARRNQLVYMACFLATFAGWFLVYVVTITYVLPDALAGYIVDFTYPRYVGPFACSIFAVSLAGFALLHGRAFMDAHRQGLAVLGCIVLAVLPLYCAGIYLRAHPPVRDLGKPWSLLQEETERDWQIVSDAFAFIEKNTPAGSRIWTVLGGDSSDRKFVQMGFLLRPFRDNHMQVEAPGLHMELASLRDAIARNRMTHVFILYPRSLQTPLFGVLQDHGASPCPVLLDVRGWAEHPDTEKIHPAYHEDAWWCRD